MRHSRTELRFFPRFFRGLAAAVAYGMVVLTVIVAVVQFIPEKDWTAHSTQMVVAHGLAALVAVWMIYRADRSGAWAAFLWSLCSLVVVGAVLWWMWWS